MNANAGAIQGIATVVLVGITGYYAVVTGRMAKSAKKTAESVAQQQMLQFIAMFRNEFQAVRTAAAGLRIWAKGSHRSPPLKGTVIVRLREFADALDNVVGTCPEPFITDVRDAINEARLIADDVGADRVQSPIAIEAARRLAKVGEEAERLLGGRSDP